jgi:hypothetical protein
LGCLCLLREVGVPWRWRSGLLRGMVWRCGSGGCGRPDLGAERQGAATPIRRVVGGSRLGVRWGLVLGAAWWGDGWGGVGFERGCWRVCGVRVVGGCLGVLGGVWEVSLSDIRCPTLTTVPPSRGGVPFVIVRRDIYARRSRDGHGGFPVRLRMLRFGHLLEVEGSVGADARGWHSEGVADSLQ